MILHTPAQWSVERRSSCHHNIDFRPAIPCTSSGVSRTTSAKRIELIGAAAHSLCAVQAIRNLTGPADLSGQLNPWINLLVLFPTASDVGGFPGRWLFCFYAHPHGSDDETAPIGSPYIIIAVAGDQREPSIIFMPQHGDIVWEHVYPLSHHGGVLGLENELYPIESPSI